MEKADRDRLDAERDQLPSQRFDRRRVDRNEHLAGRIHALGDLEGELARHQRPRAMEEQVERVRPIAAPDRVDVAEALRW